MKAILVVGMALAAFLAWQQWEAHQHRRELFDCKTRADVTGKLSECLIGVYHWSIKDASDALLADIKERYPQ